MDTINNYNEDNKKVKICKNSCGKSIYWNNNQKAYFEIDDQQKHICHKWKPSINNSQKQFSQHDISVVDTTEKILAETMLKLDRLERKVDYLKDPSAIGHEQQ
jgi:hypothetical protein